MLAWTNKTLVMKKRYFGILPNFDFNEISLSDFNLLLEHNLFYCRRLSESYKDDDDYFLKDTDKIGFGNFFIQNRKEYRLIDEIYAEMYFFDCEKILTKSELSYHIDKIEYEINLQKNPDVKLQVLEKYYSVYESKIEDFELFALFQNITNHLGCRNFYEYYYNEFDASGNYTGISDYISGIDRFYQPSILYDWENMFLVRELCQFCLNKMKELRQQSFDESLKESQDALAQEIFKNDGLKMFEFIVSKYQKPKTKAFFSYLYFFLQSKYKMQHFSSDSVLYRNYVIGNGYLPDFPRIIVTQSEKQTAKNKIESNFTKLLESYSK